MVSHFNFNFSAMLRDSSENGGDRAEGPPMRQHGPEPYSDFNVQLTLKYLTFANHGTPAPLKFWLVSIHPFRYVGILVGRKFACAAVECLGRSASSTLNAAACSQQCFGFCPDISKFFN